MLWWKWKFHYYPWFGICSVWWFESHPLRGSNENALCINITGNVFIARWVTSLVTIPFLPPATKLGQGYIFTGVCDSVYRGCTCSQGGLLLGGIPGPGGAWQRPPRDGYCCGWYASYWNAFLFYFVMIHLICWIRLNSFMKNSNVHLFFGQIFLSPTSRYNHKRFQGRLNNLSG